MSKNRYIELEKDDLLFVKDENGFDAIYVFDGLDFQRRTAQRINGEGITIYGRELEMGGNVITKKNKSNTELKTERTKTTAELALETAQKALEEIQLAVPQSEFSNLEQVVDGLQAQISELNGRITR